jgi:hypothetical protein
MNKIKSITIGQQYAYFKRQFPEWKLSFKMNKFTAIGTIQPNYAMAIYSIKIVYIIGKQPKIYVISPSLCRNSKNEKIPHIYSETKPCLYYPKFKEWTDKKYIADTIVGWCSLWLFFYESWHITGEWSGEGINHQGTK